MQLKNGGCTNLFFGGKKNQRKKGKKRFEKAPECRGKGAQGWKKLGETQNQNTGNFGKRMEKSEGCPMGDLDKEGEKAEKREKKSGVQKSGSKKKGYEKLGVALPGEGWLRKRGLLQTRPEIKPDGCGGNTIKYCKKMLSSTACRIA